MNREQLQLALDTAGIRPDAYSLTGGLHDQALCLERRGRKWAIYYSEQGRKTTLAVHATEDDACRDLYERIIGD